MDLALNTTTTPVSTVAIPMESYNQAPAGPGIAARAAKAAVISVASYVALCAIFGVCRAIARTQTYQNVSERLSTKAELRERLAEERNERLSVEMEMADGTTAYSKLEAENEELKAKLAKHEAAVAPEAKAVLEAAKKPTESLL